VQEIEAPLLESPDRDKEGDDSKTTKLKGGERRSLEMKGRGWALESIIQEEERSNLEAQREGNG